MSALLMMRTNNCVDQTGFYMYVNSLFIENSAGSECIMLIAGLQAAMLGWAWAVEIGGKPCLNICAISQVCGGLVDRRQELPASFCASVGSKKG